jgi:hypothetical protein
MKLFLPVLAKPVEKSDAFPIFGGVGVPQLKNLRNLA